MMSLSLFAKTDEILVIRTDIDKNILRVFVDSDSEVRVVSLRKTEETADGKPFNNPEKDPKDKNEFILAEVKTKKGATFLYRKGREIVRIVAPKEFDSIYGGPFKIDYLRDGANVFNPRSNIELDLTKNGDKWEVSKSGRKVKNMNVKGNYGKVLGLVGIKEITFE